MDNLSGIYLYFASLLDYPTAGLESQVIGLTGLLEDISPQAVAGLMGFGEDLKHTPQNQLEEIYTHTFDLQGVCCPYIGHHLYGENYKRSWFMAQLNHAYREKGFSVGNELPDHVAVVLRFLAGDTGDEFTRVLQNEGLLPAVEKMLTVLGKNDGNPYKKVVAALALCLQGQNSGLSPAVTVTEKEA